MKYISLLVVWMILFSANLSFATELNKIYYDFTQDGDYAITFLIDDQVNYHVINANNEIVIDFFATKYSVEKLTKKIDRNFVKNISRVDDEGNLRITLKLSPNIILANNYSITQNELSHLTTSFLSEQSEARESSSGPSALRAKGDEDVRGRNSDENVRGRNSDEDADSLEGGASFKQNNKSFVVIILKNKAITQQKSQNDEAAAQNKKFVIMIDPGHGGIDKGAIGSYLGELEKSITLSYAKELQRELAKYPQYKVLLTRDKDMFMSPEMRLKKAKAEKADIFVSIHADFNPDSKLRGASIYTLPQEAIAQETLALIEQKNKDNLLKNNELLKENEQIAAVLINMVYQDSHNSSINLAKATTASLNKEVDMLKKSHRALELKVLKGVDTPAILIELGYLSNEEEEKQLSSIQHQKLFTQALVQGINQYWQELK